MSSRAFLWRGTETTTFVSPIKSLPVAVARQASALIHKPCQGEQPATIYNGPEISTWNRTQELTAVRKTRLKIRMSNRVLSKLPLLGPGEKSWWPSSLLLGHGMRPWYPRTSARRGSGGIPDTACVQLTANNEVQALDSGSTDLVLHHLYFPQNQQRVIDGQA